MSGELRCRNCGNSGYDPWPGGDGYCVCPSGQRLRMQARTQSQVYADYITFMWDHDPDTRARIEQGVAEMEAGEGELFDAEQWLRDHPEWFQ